MFKKTFYFQHQHTTTRIKGYLDWDKSMANQTDILLRLLAILDHTFHEESTSMTQGIDRVIVWNPHITDSVQSHEVVLNQSIDQAQTILLVTTPTNKTQFELKTRGMTDLFLHEHAQQISSPENKKAYLDLQRKKKGVSKQEPIRPQFISNKMLKRPAPRHR